MHYMHHNASELLIWIPVHEKNNFIIMSFSMMKYKYNFPVFEALSDIYFKDNKISAA